MIPTLDEIKAQCRLEPSFAEEDALLIAYSAAAKCAIENHVNRKLVDNLPDAVTNELLISADIKLAMLMLIGHWYSNRESVADYEKSEVPMAFRFLVDPYRWINL
ncbi:MAG: head-tail connector protein [Plesiomonas sp.]|uniref:head-tail connector protein n=1 Tax=Plesiomonas sp. TaxID=2486279 RepID=UPI003F389886